MKVDSLIEKEFHSHPIISLTWTVYPIVLVFIPKMDFGQNLKKGMLFMFICYAKNFKIMYKPEERGNTIIRNKVRHEFDDINRHEILHI